MAEIRWVAPETLHMTLKFHGEIQQDMVESLKKHLAAIKQKGPFEAGIKGIHGFPDLAAPEVIWTGVTADMDRLKEVREQAEIASLRAGIKREKRQLKPHITLGRNKTGKPLSGETLELLRNNEPRLEPWTAESITLMRSELFQYGPKYTRLGIYKI